MAKINLTAFIFVIIIYTIANLAFAVLAISSHEMTIEFIKYTVSAPIMLQTIFYQLISLIFLILCYRIFSTKSFKENEENGYGNIAGWFVLLYQFFFLLMALYFGLGVVGQESQNSNYLIVVLSNILSADTIFFIIGSQLKSNNLFKINLFFYLISTLIRGWMGGLFIALIIYLCRNSNVRISIKYLFLGFILLILFLGLSPFLIDLKFSIRNDDAFKLDTYNYWDRLSLGIDYIFGRFQHVGHLYILSINNFYYYDLYSQGYIRSYLLEGLPQDILYRRLGNVNSSAFSVLMAKNEFGGDGWNANTGLAGWFYVLKEESIFFLLYWFGLMMSVYYLIYRYATKQLFFVIASFSIVYLYHGWLTAYFNLLLLTTVLIFIKRIKV